MPRGIGQEMGRKMKLSKKFAVILLGITLFTSTLNAATLKCLNQNNTNLAPLRTISEDLGAKVDFNKEKNLITIIYKETKIEATIGSKTALINGDKKELQVAPQVVNGTTYVPIRFVGEALGAKVDYQGNTLTVNLDGTSKAWQIETVKSTTGTASTGTFSKGSKSVNGKTEIGRAHV